MTATSFLHHALPEINARAVPQVLLDALKSRFVDQFSTALVVREQHGRDESAFDIPAAVVFAQRTQDVADAVKLASPAPACGPRSTTPTLPGCNRARAARPSPPTPVYPFRTWPTRCSTR